MGIKSEIKDGRGTDRSAGVTPALALEVVRVPDTARGLPVDVVASLQILIERFTDTTGAFNQALAVGSLATPIEFSITEQKGLTKWITGFRLVIIGPGFDISTNQIRNYGNSGGGLANGIEIEIEQRGVITPIALDPVTTTSDYFPYQNDFLNLVGAITAGDDLLNLDFDFAKPVVITEGSKDRITVRIRDDLTAAFGTADSEQFAVARGYKEATE